MERAFFISAQEVVPAKQDERVCCTSPCINEKEQKVLCMQIKELRKIVAEESENTLMLATIKKQSLATTLSRELKNSRAFFVVLTQIVSPYTIIHPGAMVVHS